MANNLEILLTGKDAGFSDMMTRASQTLGSSSTQMNAALDNVTRSLGSTKVAANDAGLAVAASAGKYSLAAEDAKRFAAAQVLASAASRQLRDAMKAGQLDAITGKAAILQLQTGVTALGAEFRTASKVASGEAATMVGAIGGIRESVTKTIEPVKLLMEAFVVEQIVESVKHALEFAGAMSVAAKQVGLTSEQLQLYQLAGKAAGVSTETVDLGLRKLSISLGNAQLGAKAQQQAFTALGIDYHQSSAVVIPELIAKLSDVGNAAKRHAIEVKLMGRAAAELDPLFTAGSLALAEFKKRLEENGMIISNELTAKSHEASVAVEELTYRLKVVWVREVAENAEAIMGLAGALNGFLTAALNAIHTIPLLGSQLAGLGGMLRNLPGIGPAVQIAQWALGKGKQYYDAHESMDLGTRQDQANEATVKLRYAMSMGMARTDPKKFAELTANANEQARLGKEAVAMNALQNPPMPKGDIAPFLGGKGHHAHEKHDPLEGADKRVADMMAQIDHEILNARKELLTSTDAIAAIEKQEVETASDKRIVDIEQMFAEGKITIAQRNQLEFENVFSVLARDKVIEAKRQAQNMEDAFALQVAANDNEKQRLQITESLSVTIKDRRDLQLQMLTMDEQALVLKRDEIAKLVALGQAKQSELDQANLAIKNSQNLHGLNVASIKDQNLTPLEQYIKSTDPKTINDRVNGLVVDELKSVRTGIDDAISSALGVQDPLLKGIIDLFVEQMLIRPIAEALQRAQAQSSGGGGGWFGQLLGLAVGVATGSPTIGGQTASEFASTMTVPDVAGFASGTSNAPPGTRWVGENGPELLKFRGGEQVFNRDQLRGMSANDGGHTFHTQMIFPNVTNAREARETVSQATRTFRREMGQQIRRAG